MHREKLILTTLSFIPVFYIFHVVMYMLILIMVGMHRPDFKTSTIKIIISAACLWFTEHFLRLAKLCWYFFGNRASVTVLPDDTMRVTLKRSIRYCTPGSHGFLWIPAVRMFETHPFTLVSNNPVEFVIRAQDGFTRDLYNTARKEPGKLLLCSMDGGYGKGPDLVFSSVVLVAGGSGASFTFSIALDLVERASRTDHQQTIDFIWTVKQPGELPCHFPLHGIT